MGATPTNGSLLLPRWRGPSFEVTLRGHSHPFHVHGPEWVLEAPRIARDEELQRSLRAAVESVRAKLNGLTVETVLEIGNIYAAAGRAMADALRATVASYGGESTWPDAAGLTARAKAARTASLLAQLDQQMQNAITLASTKILADAMRAYRMSYYGEGWALDRYGLPDGAGVLLPLLQSEAVQAAALYPYGGLTFFDRMGEQRAAFLSRMQRAIGVSQASGDTLSQATSRLLRELGVPVGGATPIAQRRQAAADALFIPARNRGLTPRRHAELIARTELQRSAAAGAEALFDANADVLNGKEWQATRDLRTCPICQALDGRVWALDDQNARTIPAHPRCRCAWLPVVKSWADLGLPGLEALEDKPRQLYREWAAERGIGSAEDGGYVAQRAVRLDRS